MTTTLTPPPTSPSPTNVRLVRGVFPPGAKILLVGEAPGADEEKLLTPFVGASGKELQTMLQDAGLRLQDCARTNVFDVRPPNNSLIPWSASKKEVESEKDPSQPWAFLQSDTARYVRPCYTQPALARLREEILYAKPNVIVALGNVALSAICNTAGIGRVRGTLHTSKLVEGIKVIPTYHPAAILRQYDNRSFVVADLMKAKAESEFPEFRLLRRTLHVEPTVQDLFVWRDRLLSASHLAFDIETKPSARQITCIGFSPTKTEAYVIPFWDRRKPGARYWDTAEDEAIAWRVTGEILNSPSVKIAQNGLYDVQYCTDYKWYVRNFVEDTMILHHSLYPSVPKGLDFLGSLYVNERAWKQFRPRGGEEKRDA